MTKESQGPVALPIKLHFPLDVQGRYATNMVVQHTEHECIISFFEAYPPMLPVDSKEREAALEQIETVPAVCVSRIIVAPKRLAEFVQVLQDAVDKYSSTVEME